MLIKTKFSIGQRVYFPSAVGVDELIVFAIIVVNLMSSDNILYRCVGSEILYPEKCLYSSKNKCLQSYE